MHIPEDRIHLLQCLPLGLRHKEIDEEDAEEQPPGEEQVETPGEMISAELSSMPNELSYHEMAFNMDGTISATAKLFIQLADAAIDVPFALVDSGKISAINVQLHGPHP